jgi:hypothetical protein
MRPVMCSVYSKAAMAAVGMSREKINEIGEPMIHAVVKCGAVINKMKKEGKLAFGGVENLKRGPALRSVTPGQQTHADIGFTRSRAQRWGIAGVLWDERPKIARALRDAGLTTREIGERIGWSQPHHRR